MAVESETEGSTWRDDFCSAWDKDLAKETSEFRPRIGSSLRVVCGSGVVEKFPFGAVS